MQLIFLILMYLILLKHILILIAINLFMNILLICSKLIINIISFILFDLIVSHVILDYTRICLLILKWLWTLVKILNVIIVYLEWDDRNV